MSPGQRRWMWATIGSHWDKDIGEYVVYAAMIVMFGKESTKELTPLEVDHLFDWILWATGEAPDEG